MRKRVFAVALIVFVVVFVLINFLFPLKYYDYIKEYSSKYEVKPELICAIIHTESKFRVEALSHRGASGLMQIRKLTADWANEELSIPSYSYDKIFEPKINIEIGCWYMNKLIKQFNSYENALCAYNAGSGNVSKWLRIYSNDGKKLNHIPFKETERYVKKVIRNEKIYRVLINLIIGDKK